MSTQNNTLTNLQARNYFPYVVWFLPLSFFTFQFILRLWPGLMMPQIMEQYSIDASQFGVLAAFYYYGYAGMQIPVAILLDKFGAQKVITGFAVICGLATLLFTFTDNFYVAVLSRFLVGAGSAVGWLGISKIVSVWFPKEHYAKLIGYSFTIGIMGLIFGGRPITMLVEHYSWQGVALTLAAISVMIGLGSYLVLGTQTSKDYGLSNEFSNVTSTTSFSFNSLSTLLSSPVIWALAIANLLMVGALEGFADVWGLSFLMKAFALEKADAAGLMSFIFFGMLFGGPILAFVNKKVSHYNVMFGCGVGIALLFTALFLMPSYHGWLVSGALFSVGVLCCYQVMVFAAGSTLVSSQQLGITIAFLNCVNMLGGSFFHTLIGKIMDLSWTGTFTEEGLKLYELSTIKFALGIVPVCAGLGALLVFFLGRVMKKRSSIVV